jgi:hypothetical protein
MIFIVSFLTIENACVIHFHSPYFMIFIAYLQLFQSIFRYFLEH